MKRTIRYQAAILRGHSILMLKIWDHGDSGKTFWVIPGGGRVQGESEEACVTREVREETHLQVEVGPLILEEDAEPGDTYLKRRTYACRVLGGEAKPGSEPEVDTAEKVSIKEIAWFDLSDEDSWDPLAKSDPITLNILRSVREALRHTDPD